MRISNKYIDMLSLFITFHNKPFLRITIYHPKIKKNAIPIEMTLL